MRTLLPTALLLLAGCGSSSPAEDVAPEGIELPTAGILGALPPREGRVTIDVDAQGVLTVDGAPCAWPDLGRRLGELTAPPVRRTKSGRPIIRTRMTAGPLEEDIEEVEEDTEEVSEQEIVAEEPVIKDAEIVDGLAEARAEGSRIEERLAAQRHPPTRSPEAVAPDGSRNTDVLLRIDRHVPWAVVAHVLQTAAHPDRKLWRIFYAVDGEDGRGEGTMAVFLPQVGCGERIDPDIDVVHVRLRSKEGGEPAETAALADALVTRLPTPKSVLHLTLVARRFTPYEHIIGAMDAALRAGAIGLVLEGLPRPVREIAECCAEARRAGAFHWEVPGEALTLRPALPAARPHRVREYVGVTNDSPFMFEELEEEVEGVEAGADGSEK